MQLGIDQLSRLVNGNPVLEGPKFHKIVHWSEWIRFHGATGNYNGEIMEKAHRVTIKGWMGSLRLNDSLAAVYKVIHKHNMYEAHETDGQVDGAPLGSTKFRHTSQGGGFRGKIDIRQYLQLNPDQLQQLASFETADNFPELHVREKMRYYSEICPEGVNRDALLLCLNVLHHEDSFGLEMMAQFDPTSAHGARERSGFLRLSRGMHRQIQLWRKSWLLSSKAYVQVGSDVQYVRQVIRDGERVLDAINVYEDPDEVTNPVSYGRILLIFSVGNNQYMLIRRWTHVEVDGGPRADESTDEHISRLRFTRTGRAGHKKYRCSDPLKRYCWWMHLENPPAGIGSRPGPRFCDLLCLSAKSALIEYPIKTVLFTQPDFNSCPGGDMSKTPRFSFLVPFVIHDASH